MNPTAARAARLAAMLLIVISAAAARAAAQPAFFPTPQKAAYRAETAAAKSFAIKADKNISLATVNEYASFLGQWGFEEKEGGVTFTLTWLPVKECEKVSFKPYQKKSMLDDPALQTYFLTVSGSGVTVKACGEDGFFYALMTFKHLYRDTDKGTIALTGAEITDFPAFPVRGVFEGAYGVWDTEGRLGVIDWMGSVKINSFMYGPKGDRKMRRSWRELYDDIELFNFKRLIERCRKYHIQFGFVLAPPQGVSYGSDEDFAVLMRKARQLQGLGVRYFILAFDDTLGMMYHTEDRARFANLGEAEAFLSNRFHKALQDYDPDVITVMVPEIYAGVWPMDYTRSLVEKLDPEIYIGWTGSEIGAPKIDAADMKKFIEFYKRQPSLGDNWGSIFPLVARTPDIYKYTTQFTMNPYNLFGEIPIPGVGGASEPAMCQVQCASTAQFAWNPAAHDPDKMVDALASLHAKPGYEQAFKFLLYKDYYHFRGYYTLDTDYRTPQEKQWIAVRDAGGKGADALLQKTRAEMNAIAEKLKTIDAGAHNPEIGKSMQVRANVSEPYFEKVEAALNDLETALTAKDKAKTAAALDAVINAIGGVDK
jgi:hyaluronoglucosaminidase